jgi:hypothetical protein
MPKAVSSSPPAKLGMPESIAAEIDKLVARTNTPAGRAASAALFSASSVQLGRAALMAREPAAKSKNP